MKHKYNKYPNGYLPKIKYWSHQVCLAAQMSPLSHISFCTKKLNYFLNKQKEWEYNQKEMAEEAKADSQIAIMKDEGLM
tara:strand:- start:1044 stop:1280 length:237 start_codon:yes stop_codon:yes gene_type:complete